MPLPDWRILPDGNRKELLRALADLRDALTAMRLREDVRTRRELRLVGRLMKLRADVRDLRAQLRSHQVAQEKPDHAL